MSDSLPAKVVRKLYRGDSRTWVHVFTDTATGAPIDKTGSTFLSEYRDDLNRSTIITSATCTVGGAANNEVTEVLSATQAELLPGQTDPSVKPVLYWDLQETDAAGNVQTWQYAKVTVSGDVSDA
jgi:hypothetical protein